ncbi:MAG: DUF1294 domain-containing protein [Anaerococcus sp.]|nr:DUF1294 domain-containing protein [Anaerococcus sp.]
MIENLVYDYGLSYFIFINILGISLSLYDKLASKKFRRKRVRERTFFILAFLGASLFIYISMVIINHKTRHKKFMVGLPLIVIFHGLIFILLRKLIFIV